MPLVFSAVPEEYVGPLRELGATQVTPLDDWGDYLYDAQALASLSGKKLGKSATTSTVSSPITPATVSSR